MTDQSSHTETQEVEEIDRLQKASNLIGWWDATLDAASWWGLSSVSAGKAATLLCRFNPDDDSYDPQTVITDETNPDDFKRLLREFTDVALDDAPRTLSQWHGIVISRKLNHHSWIDDYKAAKTEVLSLLDSRLIRLETAHEDILRNGKQELIENSAAKIEALRAELDSLRDAPQRNVLIAPELSQILGTPPELPSNPDTTSQADDLAPEIAARENANQPDCETPSHEHKNDLIAAELSQHHGTPPETPQNHDTTSQADDVAKASQPDSEAPSPEQKKFHDTEPDTPVEGGRWWQKDNNILELAQDYGDRLVNENKKPSQNAVAAKVVHKINLRESNKTPGGKVPRTISTTALKKGPMRNWKYTPKK